MRALPIAQYPEIAPPVVQVRAIYPGASAAGAGADRGRADRKRDQRRRAHALHEFHLGRQRRGADPGDLRDRHRRQPGGAERQQPREAGRKPAAAGSAPAGRDGGEGLVLVPAGAGVLFAGRPLRRRLHQQLRHAERAGPVEARAGHDQCADLRREGLRDADLAQAGPPGAAQADHVRPGEGDQRAERAVRGRQGRPVAHRPAAGAGLHHHHEGPAVGAARVRGHHRALRSRRLGGAAAGCRAGRTGRQGLRLHRPHQRPARHAGGHLPAARRQRAAGGGRSQEHGEDAGRALSPGPRLLDPVRHHAFRRSVDPRGGQDAGRSDGAGVPGGVHVPAELARDADPDHRGAGVADRHLRRAAAAGLFDQHAHAVRHGAGDRHRGGRRHRRAGKRRAHHARGAHARARGGDPGDEGSDQPDHRDRAGAVRGVRADRVPRRPDRRAVPPVRDHDLDRGGDLRHRGADADAGPVRADPQARAQGRERRLRHSSTAASRR